MLKSTPDKYGRVAITIHWVSALAIVALLASGFRADATTELAAKTDLLRIHASLGATVLILTLGRIAWWRFADQKPTSPDNTPAFQRRIGKTVHVLFYVVILGMAASGIGMLLLTGGYEVLFAGGTGGLPNFENTRPRAPHGLGARLMLALFALHVGAALYHHFVKRDGLLRRMGLPF